MPFLAVCGDCRDLAPTSREARYDWLDCGGKVEDADSDLGAAAMLKGDCRSAITDHSRADFVFILFLVERRRLGRSPS